jgi:ribosomal protein S18 acetylase RimI-like enzyme
MRMPSIRPAVLDDVAAVVDLWEREGGPTRSAGGSEEARRLLEHDRGALLVAEDGGRLVGTLIVGWDGWRCHLYRLAVERSARRAGVARGLARAARDRAVQLGAARLDAMVAPDNQAAVAFWESVGFERDVDLRWSMLVERATMAS